MIASAALVTAGMATLSLLVFGTASWQAFFDWMPVTSRVVLGEGAADWSRLQSLFGLVRAQGGGETLAWSAQGMLALARRLAIACLWRSRVAFELKAAALVLRRAAGDALSLHVRPRRADNPGGVPLRFALATRLSAERGLRPGAAVALLFSYPYVKTHVGLAATAIVAAVDRAAHGNGAARKPSHRLERAAATNCLIGVRQQPRQSAGPMRAGRSYIVDQILPDFDGDMMQLSPLAMHRDGVIGEIGDGCRARCRRR